MEDKINLLIGNSRILRVMKEAIRKILKNINELALLLDINYEISESKTDGQGIGIFLKNQYGGCSPFIFSIHLEQSEDKITVFEYWPLSRQFVDGEKTDMYILWSTLMVFLLKLNGLVAYPLYYELFEGEINGGSIMLPSRKYEISNEELDQRENQVIKGFLDFLLFQHQFHCFFGDFSTVLEPSVTPTAYFQNQKFSTTIKRKEHLFEYDGSRVFHLYIDNGVADFETILKKESHKSEIIEYSEGAFLREETSNILDYKYISKKNYKIINIIRKKYSLKNIKIL